MGDRVDLPWWIWPNLLSLDAPLIAVSWQLLLAHASGIVLGWAEPTALFLTVWVAYLADRVLDAYKPLPSGWEPARKRFYRRHRLQMVFVCAAGAEAALVISYLRLSAAVFSAGLLLAACVAAYFILVHSSLAQRMVGWPRELVVSVVFSMGAYFPVVLAGSMQPRLWAWIIFTGLCWINCSIIETWEWRHNPETGSPSGWSRWIERHLGTALAITLFSTLALFVLGRLSMQVAAASALSCVFLAMVAYARPGVSASLSRVGADAALCSPLLVLASGLLR